MDAAAPQLSKDFTSLRSQFESLKNPQSDSAVDSAYSQNYDRFTSDFDDAVMQLHSQHPEQTAVLGNLKSNVIAMAQGAGQAERLAEKDPEHYHLDEHLFTGHALGQFVPSAIQNTEIAGQISLTASPDSAAQRSPEEVLGSAFTAKAALQEVGPLKEAFEAKYPLNPGAFNGYSNDSHAALTHKMGEAGSALYDIRSDLAAAHPEQKELLNHLKKDFLQLEANLGVEKSLGFSDGGLFTPGLSRVNLEVINTSRQDAETALGFMLAP